MVDSRAGEDGSTIRRRRECVGCGRRFTTYERVEEVPLVVIKRSGAREAFSRAKVIAGIASAAKNRPVGAASMGSMASEVEEAVRLEGTVVTTERIGRAVLDGLRGMDEVAYVRFASVYKDFEDVDEFRREVGLLSKASAPKQGPTS